MSSERSERLNVILAEYKALRNEITMKLQGVYQIYTLYFVALSLFYGFVFGRAINFYDLVFAIPVVALALFLRLLYDQLIIRNIDNYEKELSEVQIPQILAAISGRKTKTKLPKVMQWLNFYGYKIPPYYKWSYFLIFPVLSVVPPLWCNIIAIGQKYTLWKGLNDFSCSCPSITLMWIPPWFLWLSALVNFGIGCWMTYKIIKDKF